MNHFRDLFETRIQEMSSLAPPAPSPLPPTLHTIPPPPPPPAPTGWRPLNTSEINGIESFLFFVGWPRSCHSIVGGMLDAHPNIIVAHEFFLFKKLFDKWMDREILFNELYKNSYESAQNGSRSAKVDHKGYTLEINGSWQGQFTELKVIGDKSGGKAAMQFRGNEQKFKMIFDKLKAEVNLPVKTIQVIRNPYDIIATRLLYKISPFSNKKLILTHKYSNFRELRGGIQNFVRLSKAITTMLTDLNLSPHQVHCEDLIADPIGTISSICQYLEVDCSADYLQMCADKTFKNVSETRHLIEWDPRTEYYLTQIKQFPFFNRYTLD